METPYWLKTEENDTDKTKDQLVKDYYDLISSIVETWSFDHGRTVTVKLNKSDVNRAKRELETYMEGEQD